jgi:hypothetical protein
MKIEGHYDKRADIAWLRFEGYDPATVVAEEVEFELRELDRATATSLVSSTGKRADGSQTSS